MEEILERLRLAPDRAARLTRGLSARAARWKPPDAEFSVTAGLCHLRDIEAEGFSLRIGRLLSEDGPILPDVDGAQLARERDYDAGDPSTALEGFRAARARSMGLLGRLGTGSEAWKRGGTLETVGPITLEGLVARMAEHDADHLAGIARLARARRPALLSGFLALLALANLFGALWGMSHREELLAAYPGLAGPLWGLYLLCPAVGIVSMVLMWDWRKWGFWLACGCAAAVLSIELYTQGIAPHVARVPIALAVLAALCRPVWGRFR